MPSEHGSLDDLCDRLSELTHTVHGFNEKMDNVTRLVARHDEDIRGNGHPGIKSRLTAVETGLVPELAPRLERLERASSETRGFWKEIRGALVGAVVAAAVTLAAAKMTVHDQGAPPVHVP